MARPSRARNPSSLNNTPVSLLSSATASDSRQHASRQRDGEHRLLLYRQQLTFSTGGTSITGNYNGATGVLTFSGVDIFALYQTVIDNRILHLDERQPDQLRRQHIANDHVYGQRRPVEQRSANLHRHRRRHQRCAGESFAGHAVGIGGHRQVDHRSVGERCRC